MKNNSTYSLVQIYFTKHSHKKSYNILLQKKEILTCRCCSTKHAPSRRRRTSNTATQATAVPVNSTTPTSSLSTPAEGPTVPRSGARWPRTTPVDVGPDARTHGWPHSGVGPTPVDRGSVLCGWGVEGWVKVREGGVLVADGGEVGGSVLGWCRGGGCTGAAGRSGAERLGLQTSAGAVEGLEGSCNIHIKGGQSHKQLPWKSLHYTSQGVSLTNSYLENFYTTHHKGSVSQTATLKIPTLHITRGQSHKQLPWKSLHYTSQGVSLTNSYLENPYTTHHKGSVSQTLSHLKIPTLHITRGQSHKQLPWKFLHYTSHGVSLTNA